MLRIVQLTFAGALFGGLVYGAAGELVGCPGSLRGFLGSVAFWAFVLPVFISVLRSERQSVAVS